MKEIDPITGTDLEITMKEIGPIAGIDHENTMTEINHAAVIDCQSTTKITIKERIIIHFRTTEAGEIIIIIIWTNMKEGFIIHFRTMDIGQNIKIVMKTGIGMKISIIVIDLMIQIIVQVEIGHMTETGHIIDRDYSQEYKGDRSYIRDRSYGRNDSYGRDRSYSRDRLQDYCRDAYKEENHRYKRRSRDYYEDAYENRHHLDKYECQFINDRYDTIRGRPKEKHCTHGDKSCDTFYAELEELYSSMGTVDVQDIPYFTVEVDVQDLQNLPTKNIDELELSDIHFIEKYILDKEEIEAQEMEKCIVELLDKQEIDREMAVLPKIPVRTACEQEEFIEEEIWDSSLPDLPKFFKAEESVLTDEIELEMPKINEVEVRELPREIKLEIPKEQGKSKLDTKQKKVLGSKVVRRANPTKVVKRDICRSPPKPPDRQNSVNYEHETKKRRINYMKIKRKDK